MTTRRCRICGWPIFGERCPFCEAWTDRMAALAAMENAEAVAEQDYESWLQDSHPAMPDVDSRREMYYQAGQYPPKPVM